MQKIDEVYLDHAATTPVRQEVLDAMLPYFSENYGNPSSLYSIAGKSKDAIDLCRISIANIIGCLPNEIVFTSGGTESDNAAIKGVALGQKSIGNHIITTSIEHHAVLDSCKFLEEHMGFQITYLPVNNFGIVESKDLSEAITPQTILVSVMYANNEVGTIQPLSELSGIVKKHSKQNGKKIIFHTDAVQAAGYLDLNISELGVDLMSISGHKIYAPKGIGFLYIGRNVPFIAHQSGGGQEKGLRSGTENVSSIVGIAKALEIASLERRRESIRCQKLRDRIIDTVLSWNYGIKLNGHPINRLPNNVNLTFPNIDAEILVMALNQRGIFVSTGSACTTGSPEPSHVLLATGNTYDESWGSLRITLGKSTDDSDVETLLRELKDTLRHIQTQTKV